MTGIGRICWNIGICWRNWRWCLIVVLVSSLKAQTKPEWKNTPLETYIPFHTPMSSVEWGPVSLSHYLCVAFCLLLFAAWVFHPYPVLMPSLPQRCCKTANCHLLNLINCKEVWRTLSDKNMLTMRTLQVSYHLIHLLHHLLSLAPSSGILWVCIPLVITETEFHTQAKLRAKLCSF
jgi:hypothetical protein